MAWGVNECLSAIIHYLAGVYGTRNQRYCRDFTSGLGR